MSTYILTQKQFSNLKRRLTFRKNRLQKAKDSKDPERIAAEADQVIREVAHANGIFEERGWPDSWSDWERAADDAKTDKEMKHVYARR